MFHADLLDADGNPAEYYLDDPARGRRVKVRLCTHGAVIAFREMDVPDYSEPPLPEQPRTSSPDPRQSPIDGDDFVTHAPEPAGARPRK